MCRFLVYSGQAVVLADLLINPKHSLINQSYQARERKEPLNGDGFGVGWYVPSISEEPCVFTSISPAWSNRNLFRLADKTMSSLVFAHVRAATKGLFVSQFNCHPFQHQNMMWMHNGVVKSFFKIKRKLRESLNDETYDLLQGTTDSEHVFALFLSLLPKDRKNLGIEEYKKALLATISHLNAWTKEAGREGASHYNFAFTDGNVTLITRYCDSDEKPESLYYTTGERFECQGDQCRIIPVDNSPKAVVVASEQLTDELWKPVPVNHLITIDQSLNVEILPIDTD